MTNIIMKELCTMKLSLLPEVVPRVRFQGNRDTDQPYQIPASGKVKRSREMLEIALTSVIDYFIACIAKSSVPSKLNVMNLEEVVESSCTFLLFPSIEEIILVSGGMSFGTH